MYRYKLLLSCSRNYYIFHKTLIHSAITLIIQQNCSLNNSFIYNMLFAQK